jgi:hypothetical protein
MNIFDKRWLNARKFTEKVNSIISENEDCFVFFDGESFDEIKIDEEHREILLVSTNCVVCIYNGDKDCDEGAHTTSKEWLTDTKQRLQIFKEIQIE